MRVEFCEITIVLTISLESLEIDHQSVFPNLGMGKIVIRNNSVYQKGGS